MKKPLGLPDNTVLMDERRVMFTISELKIVTAQHVLYEAGIVSFVVNKMDSAHAGVFGDIELFVSAAEAEEARSVLVEHDVIPITDVLPIYQSQTDDEDSAKVVVRLVLWVALLLVLGLIVIWAKYSRTY